MFNQQNRYTMNNLELNEVNMFDTVVAYSDENREITVTIPNYPETVIRFKNVVISIHNFAKEKQSNYKWITDIKKKQEEEITLLTVDTASKLRSFGRFTNNTKLQSEMKITASYLRQCSSGTKRDVAMMVYDRAQTYLPELGNYNITAETQLALVTLINSYSESIAKPGVARASRGQNKQLKKELFKEAHAALADLDATAEVVKVSNPGFYRGYRLARKVLNRGNGSLTLMVMVTDTYTGEPVKGATVSVAAHENEAAAPPIMNIVITKKSAAKGGVYVKSVASGEYTLSVTKPGYYDYSTTIHIASGERTKVAVALRKK